MRFRRKHPRAERLSDVLTRLAQPAEGSLTLADVLAAVGDRSFGALLVILAIPNMVAGLIPGLSILLGNVLREYENRFGALPDSR